MLVNVVRWLASSSRLSCVELEDGRPDTAKCAAPHGRVYLWPARRRDDLPCPIVWIPVVIPEDIHYLKPNLF